MDCAIAQSLTVRTFRAGTDKEAALKPLEEAAEAYASWQVVEEVGWGATACELAAEDGCPWADETETDREKDEAKADLADELADCITACCNLAARYGLDLQAAIDRVEARNRERGRYGSQD